MVGETSTPKWLQTDWILGQLGQSRVHAIRAYVDFVRAGARLPSVREQLRRQVYLSSDAFLQRIQALSDKSSLAEIPRAQRRPLAMPLTQYRDSIGDPKAAMATAYASGNYTMQQISEGFGVHYSTVRRAVKQIGKMRDCKT